MPSYNIARSSGIGEIMLLEKKNEPLIPLSQFFKRVLLWTLFGIFLTMIALSIGMAGYHLFEHMSWTDSFVNAAMILSGMGPFGPLQTTGGKIFAGFYALFSGLAFIVVIGTILGPVVHRFFHEFHIEDDN